MHPNKLTPDDEGDEGASKEDLFEDMSYFMFVSTGNTELYSSTLREWIGYGKSKRIPVVAIHCSGVYPPEDLSDFLNNVHKIDATKLWASMTNLSDQVVKTGLDILTYVEPMAARDRIMSGGKNRQTDSKVRFFSSAGF